MEVTRAKQLIQKIKSKFPDCYASIDITVESFSCDLSDCPSLIEIAYSIYIRSKNANSIEDVIYENGFPSIDKVELYVESLWYVHPILGGVK